MKIPFLVSLLFGSIFFLFSASGNAQPTTPPPVVAASVSSSAPELAAELGIAELATPRLALENFLKEMEKYASGNTGAVLIAMRSLDLGEIPAFIREDQGINLAVKLHAILLRTKIENYKVPNRDFESSFALRSDELGQIVLEKEGANWRFSKSTIRNIPELFYKLKDGKVLRDTTLQDLSVLNQFSLRQYIPEIFNNRIFAFEYWQLIGVVLALAIAWLVKSLCFYLFRNLTNFSIKQFKVTPQRQLVNSFVSPLAFMAAAYAYHFCLYALDLDPVVYASLLRILEVIKIVALFLFLMRAVELISEVLEAKPGKIFGPSDSILIPVVGTVIKFILVFTGLVLIANLFSVNLTGLLAGLGIGGLALALAAKDTVENLFGSITVLLDKPFKVGDFITIEGVSGSVENIGLRSTRLRTPENSLLTIPNSKLISVIVDNLGARKFFRTRVSIRVTYETSLEKLEIFCESIRELLRCHPSVRPDFIVNFNELSEASLGVLIQAYFQASSYSAYLDKQQEFFINAIKIANKLGIDFAYPTQRQLNLCPTDPSKLKMSEDEKNDFQKFLRTLHSESRK